MKNLNTLFYKYIVKKVTLSFFAILLIVSLIIFGNQLFLVLNQSLTKGIYGSELFPLVLMKFFRDFQFVLTLSFSLSIVFSLNYLYRQSELIVIKNGGIGDSKLFNILSPIIILFVFFSLIYSLLVVPEINNRIQTYTERQKARPDFLFFKEKVFQNFKNNEITFYSSSIEEIDLENEKMNDVFIYSKLNDKLTIAKEGVKEIKKTTDEVNLILKNGYIYENIMQLNPSITRFDKAVFNIHRPPVKKNNELSSKHKRTVDLFSSKNNSDIAELGFRISIPILGLILSFMAVLIAESNPRSKKNFSLAYGVIFFILYYNMIFTSKNFTEEGIGSPLINFLTPHLVILIIAIMLYLKKNHFKLFL